MGYYSTFEVIDTDIDNIADVLNDLLDDTAHPGWVYSTNREAVYSYDCSKWYDWITDLKIIASKYPNNFLVIERAGEESPDMSRAIIKNGLVIEVEPEIVWPKY